MLFLSTVFWLLFWWVVNFNLLRWDIASGENHWLGGLSLYSFGFLFCYIDNHFFLVLVVLPWMNLMVSCLMNSIWCGMSLFVWTELFCCRSLDVRKVFFRLDVKIWSTTGNFSVFNFGWWLSWFWCVDALAIYFDLAGVEAGVLFYCSVVFLAWLVFPCSGLRPVLTAWLVFCCWFRDSFFFWLFLLFLSLSLALFGVFFFVQVGDAMILLDADEFVAWDTFQLAVGVVRDWDLVAKFWGWLTTWMIAPLVWMCSSSNYAGAVSYQACFCRCACILGSFWVYAYSSIYPHFAHYPFV